MSIGALAAIFTTSFLVSLTGDLSPGPLTTLAVREGMRRGFWAGPALAAGHSAIELALVAALGLNRLLDEEWLTATIALVGGTFLLWLGAQTIRTAPRQELVIGEQVDEQEPFSWPRGRGWLRSALAEEGRVTASAVLGLTASGLAVSVANPFWVLWWGHGGHGLHSHVVGGGSGGRGGPLRSAHSDGFGLAERGRPGTRDGTPHHERVGLPRRADGLRGSCWGWPAGSWPPAWATSSERTTRPISRAS